jgi:hypothetical protein
MRDRLHHVSWMVSKVEKVAETGGLAASNKRVIACKLHPMCIEMLQHLNLSMDIRAPTRPSVIIHISAR